MLQPSPALLDFLRGWEGVGGKPVLSAYVDSVGVLTIGYGHTGHDVKLGDRITEEDAEELLLEDVGSRNPGIARLIRVPLDQNRYDALVSFAYNLGTGALAGSTLLRCVNASDFKAAALEFPKWSHAGGMELAGLLKRRVAELHIFTAGDYSARP
jgi:lysozyme